MMEAKETNHPSSDPLSSRSTDSEEQKDEEGGQEQDIWADDGQESNFEVFSSFASYDMADRPFECEVEEIPEFDNLSLSFRRVSHADVFGSNSSSRSTSAVTGRREEENIIEISHPLRLAQRIHNAANEAEVFKEECLVLAKLSDEVSDHLRSISQLIVSNHYLRDFCVGQFSCTASLKLALELLLRCGSSKISRLRRNINKIDSNDFLKPTNRFESTIEDVTWLLFIFSAIVSQTKIWPSTKILKFKPNHRPEIPRRFFLHTQMKVLNAYDSKHSDCVRIANDLRDLARENEKSKQLIVNVGVVPALLNVLKRPSFESQFAAISTLVTLASHYESIPTIVFMDHLPVIVDLLSSSSEAMQIEAASFIALLAGRPILAEGFRELDTVPPFMRFLLKSNSNNCSISYAEIFLGLSYLSEAHYLSNKQIMKNNGIPFLLKLIEKGSGELKVYCTKILPNIIGFVNHARSITKWRNIIDFVNSSMSFLMDFFRRRQALFEELLMIVENVEVDAKLRSDAIQILESLVESTYAPDAGKVITILVRQLNDNNKNFVAEVVQLLMLLNLVEMQNPREIYMTIRNFKGSALFERLVDLEEFQSHLANFFEM